MAWTGSTAARSPGGRGDEPDGVPGCAKFPSELAVLRPGRRSPWWRRSL